VQVSNGAVASRRGEGLRRKQLICSLCNSAPDLLRFGFYISQDRGRLSLYWRALRTSFVIKGGKARVGRVPRSVLREVLLEGKLKLGLLQSFMPARNDVSNAPEIKKEPGMRQSYSTPRESASSTSSAFFCFARKLDAPDMIVP